MFSKKFEAAADLDQVFISPAPACWIATSDMQETIEQLNPNALPRLSQMLD